MRGWPGTTGAQVNVAVQTNVNVDLSQIAERVITRFDHEPEMKARIAQALVEIDDEQCCVRPLIGSTRRCGCARFWVLTRRHGKRTFLRAPRGASILALTARQVGKTTTAAWAIAHSMLFMPGSLSVIACPAQRQSAEAVRRVREALIKAGAELESDNVYGLELENGSRVLALPGSDDSIRGLTVDGWIVADEAARLDMI